MSGLRISAVLCALTLAAWNAQAAPAADSSATAPPRALTPAPADGQDRPPDVSTDDLMSDEPEQPQTTQTAPPDSQPAPSVVVPKPESVQVDTLGMVDDGATGLIDSGNGGFAENMWAGSSRADIEKLLAGMALASPDSAVRALGRRVVLSKADAPAGAVHVPLINIRVRKLFDAGMADEAATLAASSAVTDDPEFARLRADAILTAGHAVEACGNLTASRLTEGDPFWLQLRTYCAQAAGDQATADLTRGVIDAQGKTDAAFNILVDDVVSKSRKPPGPIAKPTALTVFLLRQAGMPVGADVAAHLGVPARLLAMRDQRNPAPARLAVAEKIVRSGAASSAELKAVLDAQPVRAEADPEATARKLPFLAGQTLLRRAAQLESRPAVKAALVHAALALGDKAGLLEIASDLQADVAASIDAKGIAKEQAPLIGWSLLLAGKTDAAAKWLKGPDAARAVLDLAADRDDDAQASLSNIAADLSADPKSAAADLPYRALILGLYDALGRTLPGGTKPAAQKAAAQQWPGRRPDPDAMRALIGAAAAPDRHGEAALRILEIVGAAGPRDLAPDVMIEIVRALDEMGLKDAARAFALHALLLYRPPSP